MPRPQIIVTVADAPPTIQPGALTSTAFLGYAAATGPSKAIAVVNAKEAAEAGATTVAQQQVADLVAEGASRVVLTRIPVTAGDLATTDDEVFLEALAAASTTEFGVGQVLLPGLTTEAAHSALLDHAYATGRTVLLDLGNTPTAADVVTTLTPLRGRQGAERAGAIVGGVLAPITGGSTRTIAGSIVAAGAASRMDARVGHANRMVAGVTEFQDAGLSRVGTAGSTVSFTDDELDDLADVGAIPILNRPAGAMLYDWVSISDDPDWQQLNFGRMAMQIGAQAGSFLEQFLFRPIDGKGQLFAECEAGLEGEVFLPLFNSAALYGSTPAEAYRVAVSSVTTPADVAAGTLRAACAAVFTPGGRRIEFDVTVRRAGEILA